MANILSSPIIQKNVLTISPDKKASDPIKKRKEMEVRFDVLLFMIFFFCMRSACVLVQIQTHALPTIRIFVKQFVDSY